MGGRSDREEGAGVIKLGGEKGGEPHSVIKVGGKDEGEKRSHSYFSSWYKEEEVNKAEVNEQDVKKLNQINK